MSFLNPNQELVLRAEETKFEAAFHSFWVTFVSLSSGFLIAAVSQGAKTPSDVIVYVKANWLIFVVTNLVAPYIRANRVKGKDTDSLPSQ
jgi:hypothetical protein